MKIQIEHITYKSTIIYELKQNDAENNETFDEFKNRIIETVDFINSCENIKNSTISDDEHKKLMKLLYPKNKQK